jgi:hypothetical protein
MSAFAKKKYFKCPECGKRADRDFSFDNIQGSVTKSLSECKTIGHYAEKQTQKYGKNKVEDMAEGFKTKRVSSHDELPQGMRRTENTNDKTSWTKNEKPSRKVKKRKKK